jgi:8-oxo-dGTP pyrophosphatase MutT (NUDIX family)
MAEKIGIRPATVTIKDGKVLLVESKYGENEFYLFPGGGMEFGETIEEAAIRETLEETGLKVKINKLLHLNEYIYKDDWNKRSITAFFLAEPIEENLNQLTDDGGKIKKIVWVDLKDLSDLDVKPKILSDLISKNFKDLKKINLGYSVDFKE